MRVQYLEIVTTEVAAVRDAYAAALALSFEGPVPELGGAHVATLPDGGLLGVRAPLRTTEAPVVRPYWLVSDIDGALSAAVQAGAKVAVPPMEIPGRGKFAIYLLGGNDHGLWQV